MITAELPEYYVITCYTPNSQDGLARLDYRMEWEDAFFGLSEGLEEKKPVVFYALSQSRPTVRTQALPTRERGKFTDLLAAGFIDTFRYFYPDKEGIYSWWSYRFKAREKNAGWRIDYFCVSESLKDRLVSADIHTEVMGSDHCPVELVLR